MSDLIDPDYQFEEAPISEPENVVTTQAEKSVVSNSAPTHIKWREDGFEAVNPEGYEDLEDLEPIPEGVDLDFVDVDPTTRTIEPSLDKAKAWAQKKINDAERQAQESVADLAVAVAHSFIWREIKLIEQDQAENKIPATDIGRYERYPFLSALAEVSNSTPQIVVPIAKAELTNVQLEIARYAARGLLARRAARLATTVEAVKSAAETSIGD